MSAFKTSWGRVGPGAYSPEKFENYIILLNLFEMHLEKSSLMVTKSVYTNNKYPLGKDSNY